MMNKDTLSKLLVIVENAVNESDTEQLKWLSDLFKEKYDTLIKLNDILESNKE